MDGYVHGQTHSYNYIQTCAEAATDQKQCARLHQKSSRYKRVLVAYNINWKSLDLKDNVESQVLSLPNWVFPDQFHANIVCSTGQQTEKITIALKSGPSLAYM